MGGGGGGYGELVGPGLNRTDLTEGLWVGGGVMGSWWDQA